MMRRSRAGQRPGGASEGAGGGVFQERGHRRAGARPTTHKHKKTRLQVVPLRQAEALDTGDGTSGLLVSRAVPQERLAVRGPGRGRGTVVGLGGGVGRVLPVIKS